jgi:DNA repair protein RadD
MKPRDYQWRAVKSIWQYFMDNPKKGNPIVVMPTGTGKSGVIAFFIRTVLEMYPTQKIMVVTHVKELIEQDFSTMLRAWPVAPAGIYSAGLKRKDVHNSAIFAGIGSVAKRAEEFGRIDLLIIDEAHLVSPSDNTMYRKFIDALTAINPHLRVIGLTATAFRIGQGLLTDGENALFTDVCLDLGTMEEFNWFIAQGYLCQLIPKRTQLVLNVDGIGSSAGDFIQKDLQSAVNKEEITEAALREVLETCGDRQSWLIFTSGVEHAINVADWLNMHGVPCGVVHGGTKQFKMSDEERADNISRFKSGELRALANNNVLTTGFDCPRVDLIINLRPTKSPGLWVQILGRGTRCDYADGFDLSTAEGRLAAIAASFKKDCLVMDFGANTRRLGPINDPVLPKARGAKTGMPIVKTCEVIDASTGKICNTENHPSVRFCICCGAEFKFEVKIKQVASTEEIIKQDLPIVEEFKVDHITYGVHCKEGKPPMLKVTYYCGLRTFTDWVCVEHSGYAHIKARKWWQARTALPLPNSTLEASALTHQLATTTSLRVWVNKKYPEVMAHCFDGTHFGKQDACVPDITVETVGIGAPMPTVQLSDADRKTLAEYDDDLPF